MKKSEKYQAALVAVVDSNMDAGTKLLIIELLLENRTSAEYWEKKEEVKNG